MSVAQDVILVANKSVSISQITPTQVRNSLPEFTRDSAMGLGPCLSL